MTSLKKSYARQLLQLALTLSLLRVDPDSYFGYGWESQLALQNGDGWQLELRAAPLTEYPYSNRKALIPLMEDLVRFDRQHHSPYDVQTYLLNVENEQISSATASSATASSSEFNSTQTPIRNNTEFSVPTSPGLSDMLFAHSDIFGDEVSVLDQNLADLSQFEDSMASANNDAFSNFNQIYAGIPLKDEPYELPLRLIESDAEDDVNFVSAASTSSGYASVARIENSRFLRNTESPVDFSRVIEWSRYFNDSEGFIKTETIEEVDKIHQTNTTTNSTRKSESESSDDDRASTSGFSSNVELTEEVNSYKNQTKQKYEILNKRKCIFSLFCSFCNIAVYVFFFNLVIKKKDVAFVVA